MEVFIGLIACFLMVLSVVFYKYKVHSRRKRTGACSCSCIGCPFYKECENRCEVDKKQEETKQ